MTQLAAMAFRLVRLVVGLVLYGFGIALMIRADVGVAPWDVLTQGVVAQTGLGFGLVTNVVGVLVLVAWLPLKQRPGVGTVLNVLLIGPSADLGLLLVPMSAGPDAPLLQVGLFVGGLALLAVATGLYIGAGLGPGPRDGLMTGLSTRFGIPIWAARTAVEASVLVVGGLLGGSIGVGTVVFAIFVGPMVGQTLPLLARRTTASRRASTRRTTPKEVIA